jgi:hypothetical protein
MFLCRRGLDLCSPVCGVNIDKCLAQDLVCTRSEMKTEPLATGRVGRVPVWVRKKTKTFRSGGRISIDTGRPYKCWTAFVHAVLSVLWKIYAMPWARKADGRDEEACILDGFVACEIICVISLA